MSDFNIFDIIGLENKLFSEPSFKLDPLQFNLSNFKTNSFKEILNPYMTTDSKALSKESAVDISVSNNTTVTSSESPLPNNTNIGSKMGLLGRMNVDKLLDINKQEPFTFNDLFFSTPDSLTKFEPENLLIYSPSFKQLLGDAKLMEKISRKNKFYAFKKNIIQNLKDFGKSFVLDPHLLNLMFGIATDMLPQVLNNSSVDATFQIGDQVANMLPGTAGLIGRGVMFGAKAINSIGGKKTNDFNINQNTLSKVGGSYGDSVDTINDAVSKANIKYGMFSSGSRREANRLIAEAKRLQNIMTNIANEAADQRALAGDNLNYTNYNFNMSGGYDLRYMRAAKHGMKLLDKINLVKLKNFLKGSIDLDNKTIIWEPVIPEFQEGGSLKAPWEPIIDDIQEFQEGGKTRTLKELIEYAKKENPRFIQRLSEDPRGINFVDEEGKNAQGSHLLGYELDEEGNAIVFPSIQEMEDGNLKYLSLWDAFDRAIEKKNFLKMTPEEAKLFTESGEDELGNLFGYKKGWPEFFKKFKKGGTLKEDLETPEIEETNQKNLIPEGALHKNKHHMEHAEDLTKKGIPVIDEDGDQLAEIELNEIIFTLEVTKKLEELYKKYYSEDFSLKEKDEFAIDAGKLLVKEILFNTDDKTGLINKCKEGGILNGV